MKIPHSLMAATLALSGLAMAQDNYPSQPVTLVVPFTPGGSNDVIARMIGQRLSQIWQQPVVVENKAGAAGSIGTDHVAKATADGYKLLITNNNTMSINPVLLPNTPYAVARDFTQITQLGVVPVVLPVIHGATARIGLGIGNCAT